MCLVCHPASAALGWRPYMHPAWALKNECTLARALPVFAKLTVETSSSSMSRVRLRRLAISCCRGNAAIRDVVLLGAVLVISPNGSCIQLPHTSISTYLARLPSAAYSSTKLERKRTQWPAQQEVVCQRLNLQHRILGLWRAAGYLSPPRN